MRSHRLTRSIPVVAMLLMAGILLSACQKPVASSTSGKLNVVATTSIIADIVRQVGGDQVNVTSLVPIGTDIHEYQPVPRDVSRVADADIVFENGLGLEQFMATLVENAGKTTNIVIVSDGITPRQFTTADQVSAENAGSGGDPHVWMDPNNVIVWVNNIEAALSQKDPAHQALYSANAQATIASLKDLDAWIQAQVQAIPQDERQIVTDHMMFGYFAERYGFIQVGAVIPAYSTTAQPSAQDIAALEEAIKRYDVKAIFVGEFVNPTLAQRVADDTRIKIIKIYSATLSASDGPAATYQDYMRYNVNSIVTGLTGN